MDTAFIVLMVAHFFVSIAIIALVLMQRGKGADAGAAFGSGASGTVFGARGSANFLSRATAVLATVFFVNSLALAYLTTQVTGPDSVVESQELVPTPDVESTPAIQDDLGDVPAFDDELPATPDDTLPDAASDDASQDAPPADDQ
jgi:preprotein translocase subunit SecG